MAIELTLEELLGIGETDYMHQITLKGQDAVRRTVLEQERRGQTPEEKARREFFSFMKEMREKQSWEES